MHDIVLENICKSYTTYSTDILIDHAQRQSRTRQVLKNVSISFPAGRLHVILGRSGCGKSTLLKILSGEEKADSGSVSLPERWHTAMLRPDPYVITWTSVLQNVAMAGGAGRTPEERAALAQKLVRLVHLEEYADLTPAELSTGMRQRLGLARVLASQAQLLLLDEPFAALDFITREELQRELLVIQRQTGRTMLLVTHQLEEALALADRIYVMESDGTVETFDLPETEGVRSLRSPDMEVLRQTVTEACRR